MKKIVLLSLVVIVVIIVSALMFSSCATATPSTTAPPTTKAASTTSAPAAGNVIQMKFAQFQPPTHANSQIWEQFCAEIEKRTNDQVKVTFFPGGSLLDAPHMADGIQQGLADMGFVPPSQTAGRFPVFGAVGVQVGFPSAFVASHVADDFIAKFQPKELADYHVIAGSATGPMCIWTKSKPVRTLADLKGMKIRDIGTSADRLQLLGATTVGLSAPETYDGISKGVIDGCSFPIAEGLGNRMAEVCKYATRYWQISSSGSFFVVMNGNTWNKLPSNIQSIFSQASSDWVDKNARTWNDLDIQGAQFSKEKGVEFVDVASDEIANWQKASSPLRDKFTQDMLGRGFTKEEVSSWFDYMGSRTSYWLQKQIELGIKSPIGPKEILQ